MHEGLAYATTLMIVALVIALPGTRLGLRLGPASIAGLGVALLVLAGVVSPADIIDGIAILWRPFLTVLSIMLTTALAQRLGVLEYFAALIHFGPMRTRHNFFCVFTLSALTSAVLNNDAAIMLVTPLIVSMVRRCYPKRPNLIVAFAFAVFSAAGVAPLVISNPMNLIVAEYAGIGFNEYAYECCRCRSWAGRSPMLSCTFYFHGNWPS